MKSLIPIIICIYSVYNVLHSQPTSRFPINATSAWRVDPIPSNGIITIENMNVSMPVASFEIYSILGSMIESIKATDSKSSTYKLDIINLKKVVYFLTINSSHNITTKQIIVN